MRTYKATKAPRVRGQKVEAWADQVSDWLDQDSLRVERAAQADNDGMVFTVLYAEPSRLVAGMLVYAEGSSWNPGSGEGLYRRNAANSAWVFVG